MMPKLRNYAPKAVLPLTLIVAGLAGCVPVLKRASSYPPGEQVGRTDTYFRCAFKNWPVVDDCSSYLAQEVYKYPPDSARFARWRSEAKWDTINSIWVSRPNGQSVRIMALTDARRTALRQLKTHGAIVALILADANGAADPVYPIGGKYTAQSGFTDSFYVAIDTFGVLPHVGDDVPFAQVRIYGVRSGLPVRLPGRGAINWCRHSGPAMQTKLALMASCKMREQLAEHERNLGTEKVRALLSMNIDSTEALGDLRQLLQQVRQMNTEPGSLPCSAGCCYASFDPSADAALDGTGGFPYGLTARPQLSVSGWR